MPVFFREHKNGAVTVILVDGYGGERKVVGPLTGAESSLQILKHACDRVEALIVRDFQGPRPKAVSRGRQRPRPKD